MKKELTRRDFLKVTGASIAGATLFGAAGCGGGGQQGTGTTGGQQGSGTLNLRFGNANAADHPFNRCGVQPLAEQVNNATNGSVTIDNFPNSQLGDLGQLAESVDSGNLDMALLSPPTLAERYSPVIVVNAPYLFDSIDEFLNITNDSAIAQDLWDGVLQNSNIRILGTWYYGTRQLTTQNTEVRTPEDVAGLQIRSVPSDLRIAMIEAWGASATPVSFPELYTALQQGTVDGQENPIPTIAAQNFGEVQNYLMLTNHLINSNQVAVSEQTWQNLSGEQQSALRRAVQDTVPKVRQCLEKDEEEALANWRETGQLQIVEDVNVDAFREATVEPVRNQFSDRWGDFFERIQNATS